MRFLGLVASAMRLNPWWASKRAGHRTTHFPRGILFSGVLCSGCCIAFSIAAVVTSQIAFSRVGRGNQFGLSQDQFYDLICSTLDFAQGTFSLVGSFFLGAAALRLGKTARLAAWFMLLGFLTSALQIAEVGLHTGWTAFLDDWLTPGTEILQQTGIAACFWGLLFLSGPESRVKGNPAQGEAVGRTV